MLYFCFFAFSGITTMIGKCGVRLLLFSPLFLSFILLLQNFRSRILECKWQRLSLEHSVGIPVISHHHQPQQLSSKGERNVPCRVELKRSCLKSMVIIKRNFDFRVQKDRQEQGKRRSVASRNTILKQFPIITGGGDFRRNPLLCPLYHYFNFQTSEA